MQGLHIHTTRPFNLARGNFEWRLPSDSESNLQQFQVKTTSYLYQCSTGIYSWTSFIHFLYNQYYLYPTQYHSVTCQSTLACATIVYIHASTSTLKACVLRFITGDFFLTHHCIIHKEAVWCSLRNWREQHFMIFVYMALLKRFPASLSFFMEFKHATYDVTLRP